jgi:hypothetical protein
MFASIEKLTGKIDKFTLHIKKYVCEYRVIGAMFRSFFWPPLLLRGSQ